MKTVLTDSALDAAGYLNTGGIVAFPTETVYGLGANIFDEIAVGKIFAAKGRPADNPLIAHIADLGQITELSSGVTANGQLLIDAFFPGPLTLVFRKSSGVPLIATAGLETIGIRMPRFELAHGFLAACRTPVAAPSANLSGKPSPTTWEAVAEDLDGRIDCILKGPATEIGLESTVVDCTGDRPVVLRRGSISLEDLRGIVPVIQMNGANQGDPPKSPGLRHRHYSPQATVIVVDANQTFAHGPGSAFIGLSTPATNFAHQMILLDVESYARALFEFFRECDRLGLATIYCESVPENGIGAAVMDRIRRAELLD